MSEGLVANKAPRLRIKGKWPSVVRFFNISVAFTVLWILVTSQLGHYSKLYGPQILLQLNLAFYLPSIPVLLLSGSLERALDARLGPIGSISLRLNSGLAGCLLLAALFPLLPGQRLGDGPLWPILTVVAVLGGLSAVAFSTSYQLVQYFRAADTIGLGVGCVGSGPLVLLVQLALRVGPAPARWQWIAMFEVAAGVIGLGLVSSTSLCGQYWHILTAAAGGGGADGAAAAEGRVPLLAAADDDAAAAMEAGGGRDIVPYGREPYGSAEGVLLVAGSPPGLRPYGSGGLRVRSRAPLLGRRPTTAPDPFNVFNLLTPGLDGGFDWGPPDDDNGPPVLLRRSASAGTQRAQAAAAVAARRREALARLDRSTGAASRTSSSHPLGPDGSVSGAPATPPVTPEPGAFAAAAARSAAASKTGSAAASASSSAVGLSGMASAPPALPRGGGAVRPAAAVPPAPASTPTTGVTSSRPVVPLDLEFGSPDPDFPGAATPTLVPAGSSGGLGPPPPDAAATVGSASRTSVFAAAAAEALTSTWSGSEPPPPLAAAAAGPSGDAGATAEVALAEDAKAAAAAIAESRGATPPPPALTVNQEVALVVRDAWQVLLGFLVSVTILYIVFPFFTYVPTSGWLGDSLPQFLFYGRLFFDLGGRMLPRVRAAQVRSGGAVLALSAACTGLGALFFVYILAPQRAVAAAPQIFRNDAVPLALVVILWLTGGYTNTIANMLAPAMVAPELAGRASALMALLFNVGHIGGLVVAAVMAAAIWGDVVG
ncbi:hypothetical protein HYH03_015803 [Edaphochlamys debaryana]|uniref:Uncharacterized protein n=1 Tax=Edaphochlamys debaryana TaxID=47281 RepID=A0A835XNH2_9CHLO|nr:hypothetical protein HYH03_015803 [Edaphochlamys debaryana]|eukprot:KAG2485421.1 hypothetical protein HYH03_015803 [Edaphochlamys debaryana]